MTTNREDPPPYTPTPAVAAGESTLEHGPSRPYQSTTPAQSSAWPRLQHHVLANNNNTTRSPSVLRQLTSSFNNLVNQLDHPQQTPTQNTWPDQRQASSSSPPVPSSSSSTFVHDFYATGTGVQSGFAPPPGPPPGRQAESNSIPDDGRPTSYPAIGHPLLHDGQVLVYPKRYKCDKCDNIGYKDADPSRPCNRCWNKYARPFSGPLAYSFSSNSSDGNFQRPLPPPVHQRPSIFDPPGAFQTTSFPPQPIGFGPSPPIIHGVSPGRPTNAVVYTAGDPRIGGVLCWRCGGKGHISFLFLDSLNCEVCSGIGRVFQ